MENINKRLSVIEKTIKNIYSSLKKIEDCKKKSDLNDFSINQLIKWLKENEVEYREDLKDNLVDLVWKNMNEWEWEYYSEDDQDNQDDQDDHDNQENDDIDEESDNESSISK